MDKNVNGYMSLESALIFPIIIFLSYLIILSASLLLDRCLMAQNDYVIALRGATFSGEIGVYGQVIYGNDTSFDRCGYMEKLLNKISNMYIFFPVKSQSAAVEGEKVLLRSFGEGTIGKNEYECECRMNNPIMRIRECRY